MQQKVRYACVDCGVLSTYKYPNHFTQPKESYRCYKCAHGNIGKVQYACIDCGNLSRLDYPSTFKQSKEKYKCKKCGNAMKNKRRDTVKKVQYACIDCGKLSVERYPCEFTQPKKTYRCHKCASGGVDKVQYACIDCGALSTLRCPTSFMQPKEKYKCKKCGCKQRSQNPNWKKNQKHGAHKRSQNPRCKENQKIAQNRPEVKSQKSQNGKKRWVNPEARKRQSEIAKIAQNRPEVKHHKSEVQKIAQKKRFGNPTLYEQQLIINSGQGFWYGHKILHPENKRKRYCELWNKDLWVRIDASWDYKSAISEVTRWDTPKQKQLDRHHVYWQEKACCEWDEDTQGYFAMINNGTTAKPDMVKYYIKGDPNKFVLLTHSEHGMVKGSKKSGKDKIYWVKYFEDLIEKREAEGKKCYLSPEEYEAYKVENAEKISFYTQTPEKYNESVGYNLSKITNNGELQPTEQTISDGNKASDQGVQVTV